MNNCSRGQHIFSLLAPKMNQLFWTDWHPVTLLWDHLSSLVTFTRRRCKYGCALSFPYASSVPLFFHFTCLFRVNNCDLKYLLTLILQNGLPWSTSCIEPRFYTAPFKFEFNQLLIFLQKFSPLPGFELGTSPVPSRYATSWAILAWIQGLAFMLTSLTVFASAYVFDG